MTELKFVGRVLPGRDRNSVDWAEIIEALKRRPGEWAEIKRTPLTSYHHQVTEIAQRLGAECKTRRDPEGTERIYYARWPENRSNGSGD